MGELDPKNLFLGKLYDSKNKPTEEKLLYDPADLNTHCVITGMTGSGKTGLGIVMLEEIARKNIPAIIIDPKGDLTNLLLHFPNLAGEDFSPWLDPELPARTGKDLDTLAAETAENWKKGLESWGFTGEDVATLNKIGYTVFTPGSTIGNPVNIMASFSAPEVAWRAGDENIRDEISTSVTALLGLVGLSNIDPIQSREHILLSNIIEFFWSQNKDVTLVDMINAIADPPFEMLGALSVDTVYPRKDRMTLAMSINNFLASPSFQSWNLGPSLDIGSLLYDADNKARFNIFYIQHLSDQERMFFVTMLYSQVESWMRLQSGTGNLRLAVYFDEVAGYLPPISNPPSRTVILRMLKQARAFGVGLILATQNPIDLDYKALSNTGTWFVGRLQTEQDKDRLIDGLSTTAGEINRTQASKLISALEKRSFVYMNIHEPGLQVMSTRWALNYLAGPLTRNLIPLLLEMGMYEPIDEAGVKRQDGGENEDGKAATPAEKEGDTDMEKNDGSRPVIAATINEYFMEPAKTAADCSSADGQITYMAAFMAQAETRIIQRKYNMDFKTSKASLIEDSEIRGTDIRWGDYAIDPIDPAALSSRPASDTAKYIAPPEWMTDAKLIKSRETDFIDYIYRDANISVKANEKLDVYAGPETPEEDFAQMCQNKIADAMEAEKEKLTKAHEKELDKFESKLKSLQMKVNEKEEMLKQRNIQKVGAIGELALSLLQGRRKSVSSSINKFGQSNTAEAALEKAVSDLETVQEQIQKSMDEFNEAIASLQERWEEAAEDVTDIPVSPMKKDIYTDVFGIVWEPYFTNDVGKLVKAC